MKMTIKLQGKPLVAGLFEKINVTIPLDKKYGEEADILGQLKPDEYYEVSIVKKSGNKTLTQNGYAWELMREIAYTAKISPTKYYRQEVEQTPNYVITRVKNEKYGELQRTWESNGLGWICKLLGSDDEWTEAICFYGMSAWNKEQTSMFIDKLIQDAKALGLPVSKEYN